MRVAIVGPSSRARLLSHYDDSWEVWGLNSVHNRTTLNLRWAKMFNLHRYRHLERDCPQYIEWDTKFSRRNPKVPIIVVDSWKGELANEKIFPKDALDKKLPRNHYHASSFDWMVAYAIYLGAKQIDIHGADFAIEGPGQEPIAAHACLEYWCGYAEGRGIKVNGEGSEMFLQYHLVRSKTLYGWDDVKMVEDRR